MVGYAADEDPDKDYGIVPAGSKRTQGLNPSMLANLLLSFVCARVDCNEAMGLDTATLCQMQKVLEYARIARIRIARIYAERI